MLSFCSRRTFLTVLGGVSGGLLLNGSAAFARYWEPQRGTALRRTFMDTARPVISGEVGGPIEFVVDILKTDGAWAYLQARPQRPGGVPIDWRQTPFADDWAQGFFDEIVMVLFRFDGSRWRVQDYFIGPTDVAWYGWINRYGLPEALFAQ